LLEDFAMNVQAFDRVGRAPAPRGDMILVPGRTFCMGSDRHYPEEAPNAQDLQSDQRRDDTAALAKRRRLK
jgi:hypothetical protein